MKPIKVDSKILDRQRAYLYGKAREKMGDVKTEVELQMYVDEAITLYYKTLGNPLFQARKAEDGQLPFIEEYEENNKEIDEDLSILFAELNIITTYLVEYFNYAQAEQKRITGIIQGINGLVGDLQLLSEENLPDTVYMKESFTNYDLVETNMTVEENRAQIGTREGIMTLKRTGSTNRSVNGKIIQVQGNGTAGTKQLVRRLGLDENDEVEYKFVSEQTPNNKTTSIIDGSPDSIFEYQMVNVPENFKEAGRRYDFEWAKGDKNNDVLRVKIVVELEDTEDINWLNINPYYPPNSTGKLNVYSIRTSEDGFEYKGLYTDGKYVINNSLNSTPQSYRLDDVFTGSNDYDTSKFAGQGVWSFPTRKAKYVEIVLDQDGSYTELIGLDTYYKRKKGTTAWTRIRRQDVRENIVQGKTGEYNLDSTTEVKKRIEATEGWRYVIGLRDINIMSYEFVEASEYISKLFTVADGYSISEMILYANEKTPESYIEKIATTNDWIRYYVSFDDITWTEVSPTHRQPVKDKEFPPKIVAVNGNQADIDTVFDLYRTNLTMNANPKQVRVKIIMNRPKGDAYKATTPIVEDYALKIVTKEEPK